MKNPLCKICQTPTDPINMFDGECVDCQVDYASDNCDKYSGQDLDVNTTPPEMKDPLHDFGGQIFDPGEPHI